LPVEIYEAIKVSWERMDRYFTSCPFSVEDMMTENERIAYHRSHCHFQDIEYDPTDWNDEEDDDPDEDEDE